MPIPLDYVPRARALCSRRKLAMHLDGARIFNAAVSQHVPVTALTADFDSASVCLSKGLGAPAGSVLCGSVDFIASARRWRKMLGGGMRQSGVLAAAGIHALNHHVERLEQDHTRAARLVAALHDLSVFEGRVRSATNMVFVELASRELAALSRHLEKQQIRVRGSRWVVHLDVDDDAIQRIVDASRTFQPEGV